MRRQDREIVDQARIWDILRQADVCRIAFCDEGWPYIVPMNFGCLDGRLYFHCATGGTKLDLLKSNANVCFEAEAYVEITPGSEACGWSTRYQSVIGFGHISIVEKPEEKRLGIQALLSQYARYTDRAMDIPTHVPENTLILRLDIERIAGKESTKA
ncbi:pyridoxamine 5'-phosphate oxidase family protein [Candidatus Bipolaricaulota bacterium]|nr:pyridoxamine 5'-phosphate oxidase family protein [Candidatus Bipolaricaulota bacterium]